MKIHSRAISDAGAEKVFIEVDVTDATKGNVRTIMTAGTNEIGKVSIVHGIPNWSQTQDSAANTAQTITKAAGGSGVIHYATGFEVVLSAAAAANDITIELKDGAAVLWKTIIGSTAARGARVSQNFSFPIVGTANTAMTLVISAGGVGAITTANLMGYSR